jgi:pimeloyl-ACP methyl ester carboxylesterase
MIRCGYVEIQVAFGRGIRGVLHRAKVRRRAPAVCMLHGFTGDKSEEGRLFVRAARTLAASGIHVLRFDFRGNGDSDGDFADMTLSGEVDDARAAIAFLRRTRGVDRKRIGLIGHSLGSIVAQLVAARERVSSLVLWATITRPLEVFGETLVFDAALRGFRPGAEFLRQVRECDPLMMLARYAGPLLCVHGEEDFVAESHPRAALAVVAGILHVVQNGSHSFGEYGVKGEAIDVTRRFLEGTLRPGLAVSRSAPSATKRAKSSAQ